MQKDFNFPVDTRRKQTATVTEVSDLSVGTVYHISTGASRSYKEKSAYSAEKFGLAIDKYPNVVYNESAKRAPMTVAPLCLVKDNR